MDVNVNVNYTQRNSAMEMQNNSNSSVRTRLMTQAFRQYWQEKERSTVIGTQRGNAGQYHQKTVTFSDDFDRLSTIPETSESSVWAFMTESDTYTSVATLDEDQSTDAAKQIQCCRTRTRKASADDKVDEYEQDVSLQGFLGSRETALLSDAASCSAANTARYHRLIMESRQAKLTQFSVSQQSITANQVRLREKRDQSPKAIKHGLVCGDASSSSDCNNAPDLQQINRRSSASCLPAPTQAANCNYSDSYRLVQRQGMLASAKSLNSPSQYATLPRKQQPLFAYLSIDPEAKESQITSTPKVNCNNMRPLQVSVAQSQSVRAKDLQRLDSVGSCESSVPSPISICSSGSVGVAGAVQRAEGTNSSTPSDVTWRNADHKSVLQVEEVRRKREYRIGLNLFNRKPDLGLQFLIEHHFIDGTPKGVAEFFQQRKGLSKQMIGEFLGDLQNSFSMHTLRAFATLTDFANLTVDAALRKFLQYFRLPGEAQKIEQILDVFAKQYCSCNPSHIFELFNSSDTLFLLSYAIIMLNTDLHNPNVKHERKMKLEDFVKNLKGVDEGCDVRQSFLAGIYNRIKAEPIKPGIDHVTQIEALELCLFGPHPSLVETHRRLVCYCQMQFLTFSNPVTSSCVSRLSSGSTKLKKDDVDLFLFNDILLVTRRKDKRKQQLSYVFMQSYKLSGMKFQLISAPFAEYGFSLFYNSDECAAFFNAKSESDRVQFARDLHECVLEVAETEQIFKLEARQERLSHDSGVLDLTPSSSLSSNSSNLAIVCRNSSGSGSGSVSGVSNQHQHQHRMPPVTANSSYSSAGAGAGDACSEESLDSGIHNR